jgi:hypothetical protein
MLLASAQSASAGDDDPRKVQAEPHLREGRRLFDQGRYEDALGKLKQTYEIFPSPNVLTLIAIVEQKLGLSLDAIGHFRQALQNPVIHPENAEMARKGIAELEQRLARIEVQGPRGLTVTIGKNEYVLPLKEPLDAEPGTVIGVGKLAGETYRGAVLAVVGKKVVLEMSPDRGSAPITEPPPTEPTETRWGTGQYLGLGLVGVGIAGLATGSAFTMAKSNANDDVARLEQVSGANDVLCGQIPLPRACSDIKVARDDSSTYDALATAFFVGGGVALVGGAVMFFALPQKKVAPTSGVSLTPRIGTRSVGVELRF